MTVSLTLSVSSSGDSLDVLVIIDDKYSKLTVKRQRFPKGYKAEEAAELIAIKRLVSEKVLKKEEHVVVRSTFANRLLEHIETERYFLDNWDFEFYRLKENDLKGLTEGSFFTNHISDVIPFAMTNIGPVSISNKAVDDSIGLVNAIKSLDDLKEYISYHRLQITTRPRRGETSYFVQCGEIAFLVDQSGQGSGFANRPVLVYGVKDNSSDDLVDSSGTVDGERITFPLKHREAFQNLISILKPSLNVEYGPRLIQKQLNMLGAYLNSSRTQMHFREIDFSLTLDISSKVVNDDRLLKYLDCVPYWRVKVNLENGVTGRLTRSCIKDIEHYFGGDGLSMESKIVSIQNELEGMSAKVVEAWKSMVSVSIDSEFNLLGRQHKSGIVFSQLRKIPQGILIKNRFLPFYIPKDARLEKQLLNRLKVSSNIKDINDVVALLESSRLEYVDSKQDIRQPNRLVLFYPSLELTLIVNVEKTKDDSLCGYYTLRYVAKPNQDV